MPRFLVEQGIVFEIQTSNQYNKNDIVLVKITPDRQKILITKVEFEYGANQEEWDFEFPLHKWQALNLVTRKNYGETFELFIKSSRTFNSFFAIDCRDRFVQKNFGAKPETLPHNLGFETNDEFYRIYWKDATNNRYRDRKGEKILDNGNICMIEDNLWDEFYSFLWRRFLKS